MGAQGGGFHSMGMCRNDGVKWQRQKHSPRDNNPKRCPNRWGRGRHETINTKDRNGLQWCKQHMQKSWLYSVCLPQKKMILVLYLEKE